MGKQDISRQHLELGKALSASVILHLLPLALALFILSPKEQSLPMAVGLHVSRAPGEPQHRSVKSPSAPAAPDTSDSGGTHTVMTGPQSSGPISSSQESVPAATASYGAALRSKIEAVLEYPLSARRRRLSGTSHVRITLGQNGALVSSEIAQSSGSPELDQLALAAVKSAAPYPDPDPELKKMGRLVVNLPIEFRLR